MEIQESITWQVAFANMFIWTWKEVFSSVNLSTAIYVYITEVIRKKIVKCLTINRQMSLNDKDHGNVLKTVPVVRFRICSVTANTYFISKQ